MDRVTTHVSFTNYTSIIVYGREISITVRVHGQTSNPVSRSHQWRVVDIGRRNRRMGPRPRRDAKNKMETGEGVDITSEVTW